MTTFLIIVVVLILALAMIVVAIEQYKVNAMEPDERVAYLDRKKREREEARVTFRHGQVNAAMVCPHCQVRGRIRTKATDRKKGVSGGKATAALLTGGVSMLATGLSRTEHVTRAFCENCNNGWEF